MPNKPPEMPYRERRSNHQMRVCFSRRNSGPLPGSPEHGVTNGVALSVREAINDFFPKLTSDFGWPTWNDDRIHVVNISGLGPGMNGLAAIDAEGSYIVISPRIFDGIPKLVKLRRRGTIAHELVHLLQFQSPLFRHYCSAKFLPWDPNWWLHEAVALAIETHLVREYPTAFSHLWEWVTQPHLSLETDVDGIRALPFLMYLMDHFSTNIPASLYLATSENVPSMQGLDILDRELAIRVSDLASEFLKYCVRVSPFAVDRPWWLHKIFTLMGSRSYCERYKTYPFKTHVGMPIQHMGCRYFRFKPADCSSAGDGRRFELCISNVSHPNKLRGQLSIVRKSREIEIIEIGRVRDSFVVELSNFDVEHVDYAVLTLANCAFGPGWLQYDDLRFALSGQYR